MDSDLGENTGCHLLVMWLWEVIFEFVSAKCGYGNHTHGC